MAETIKLICLLLLFEPLFINAGTVPPPTTTTNSSDVTPTPEANTTTTTTTTKDSSTKPTTTSTLGTTTTTPPTTTTVAPALGVNCSESNDGDQWCNNNIDGSAVCGANGLCTCDSGQFELNISTCLSETVLTPTNLQTNDVTNTSFTVSWTRDYRLNDLSLSYSVSAEKVDSGPIICDILANARTATCSGLDSGYMYNITITTTFNNHSATNVTRESTRPNQPGMLDRNASDFNATTLLLVWTGSSGKVDMYYVKVVLDTDPSFNKEDVTRNQTQVYIKGLVAGLEYKVFITAYSEMENSTVMEDTFRTLTDVPGPPENIILVSKSTKWITISWSLTDKPNGNLQPHRVCIKYRIYADKPYGDRDCENVTGLTATYNKTGLFPGRFYQFQVYTRNEEFISTEFGEIIERTDEDVPWKVKNLKAVPNDTSITVTWSRPSKPNGDIIKYRIEWRSNEQNCTVFLKNSTSQTGKNQCVNTTSQPTEMITDPPTIDINQHNMSYTIYNLMPHTMYEIFVWAYTSVGPGTVDSRTTKTNTAIPDPVTNVMVKALSPTDVNVSWMMPAVDPGPIKYTVTTNNMIDGAVASQTCSKQGFNSSSCLVTGLEENWVYSFNVTASTDAGSSAPVQSNNITTEEGRPGQISSHSYKLFNGSDNCDATKVSISWTEPLLYDRNSIITGYRFQDRVRDNEYAVENPDVYAPISREYTKVFTGLEPEMEVQWEIYAIYVHGNGERTSFEITQGVCAPPDWNDNVINSVEAGTSNPSAVTIKLSSTFFAKSQQGRIVEKGLIIIPKDSGHYDGSGSESIKQETIEDWKKSRAGQFTKEYKIVINDSIRETYTIGEDSSCSTTGNELNFCNGPLPEKFPFKLAAYVCTKKKSGGLLCTVSSVFGSFTTSSIPSKPGSGAWIIAVAVLIVLAVVIAAFGILWFRGIIDPKSWLKRERDGGNGPCPLPPWPPEDENIQRNRPIPLKNYSSVLEEMHRDTNLVLSDQYDDINKIGALVVESSTTNAAKLESNTPKNRWVNILPFDHSRVKLQQIDEDDPTSDYINANYIPGFNNSREYIATQGPLPGTIDDFWRMVWEHNVLVIVMLTQCKEGNRVKCEKYWPDELREPKQYGEVIVNPISISQLDKYNISIFEVSVNGNKTRQVTHFHYLDFPDFSANVEFDHFINFVRTVRSHVPHNMTGPMVIHCSAGVGRTGTFIATDRLNLYLKSPQFNEDDTVDIFGIVAGMRENRVAMVQTESQFIMIHDCFEKMLEEKKKSMQMTESEENLYANQGFEPYPEVLYENVPSSQQQTEL